MDLYDTINKINKLRSAEDEMNAQIVEAQREKRPAERFAEGMSLPASEQMREPRVQQPETLEPEIESPQVATQMKYRLTGMQPGRSPGGPNYVLEYAYKAAEPTAENVTPAETPKREDLIEHLERLTRETKAGMSEEDKARMMQDAAQRLKELRDNQNSGRGL